MIKNLLALVGLAVVSQKAYSVYREYSALKAEKAAAQSGSQEQTACR